MAISRLLKIHLLCVPLLVGCAGSAGLQDWHYNHTNRSRAASAWRTNYDRQARHQLGSDFGDGYKAGYFDVATGKDCRVPPVPPPKYWAASYQCCEGQESVQAWFKGYQCGVAAAEGCGFPAFNDVPVSACAPTVSCGPGGCYVPEPCEDTDCQSEDCHQPPAWSESYELIDPQPAAYDQAVSPGFDDAISSRAAGKADGGGATSGGLVGPADFQ